MSKVRYIFVVDGKIHWGGKAKHAFNDYRTMLKVTYGLAHRDLPEWKRMQYALERMTCRMARTSA